MKNGVYDNRSKMQREYWIDVECIETTSASIIRRTSRHPFGTFPDIPKDVPEMEGLFDFEVTKSKPCKGLIFRGFKSLYMANGVICKKEGVKLLKRMSCPGCEQCFIMMDELREFVNNEAIIIPEIEHGALYTPEICNIHTDFESGIVDDYDIMLAKYTPPAEEVKP